MDNWRLNSLNNIDKKRYDKNYNLIFNKQMPNGDKTGPQGKGPLTGRGMGSCGSFVKRGFASMKNPWVWAAWGKGLVAGLLLGWWLL